MPIMTDGHVGNISNHHPAVGWGCVFPIVDHSNHQETDHHEYDTV